MALDRQVPQGLQQTEAVDHAREGNGSVLIEAMTYRRKGHAEHDNQAYVPEGEIEWWAEHNDPITRYEKFLSDKDLLSGAKIDSIRSEINDFLDAEAAWAEKEPLPDPLEAAKGVFDNSLVKPALKKPVLKD